MKPKSSGLPNEDEDDVVSFGSDEATIIRPRSVLDDAFDARTIVQIGNRSQFGQNLEPVNGQRFGDEPKVTPVAEPKANPAPTPKANLSPEHNLAQIPEPLKIQVKVDAPAVKSPLPDAPANIEAKRFVAPAPAPAPASEEPPPSSSIANAVTGRKLRKDLSAGTNTNFPIPKPEHAPAELKLDPKLEAMLEAKSDFRIESKAEPKLEVKPEMKRAAPTPAMTSTPAPTPISAPAPFIPSAPSSVEVVKPKQATQKSEVKHEKVETSHHESHHDAAADDGDNDRHSYVGNDIHMEPKKRPFPKMIVAAVVSALAVVAYFVFGTSAPQTGSSKEMASAKENSAGEKSENASPKKTKTSNARSVAAQQKQADAPTEEASASVPIASVSGGTQAVLQQFTDSFGKTQSRTRPDAQGD